MEALGSGSGEAGEATAVNIPLGGSAGPSAVAATGADTPGDGSGEPPPTSGIELSVTTLGDAGVIQVDVTVASALTASAVLVRLRPDPGLTLDVTGPLELGSVTPGDVRHARFTVTVPGTGQHRLGVNAEAHAHGHVVAASTRWLRWGQPAAEPASATGPELRVLETGERLLVTRSTRQIQADGSGDAPTEESPGSGSGQAP